MLRILIADDHALIRKGLKQILIEEYGNVIVEEVGNAEDAFKKLKRNNKWDLFICDISMPGKSGLDVLRHVRYRLPKLPILILSIHSEEQYAIRAIKAGAAGYLCKQVANDELVMAVRNILQRGKYISTSVAERMANEIDPTFYKPQHEKLTDQEYFILKHLASGKTSSEIAKLMGIKATSVRNYKVRIQTKLSVKGIAEITRYAIENCLV
jgi:two-component system, NarL family, invasion response regulator UvrY